MLSVLDHNFLLLARKTVWLQLLKKLIYSKQQSGSEVEKERSHGSRIFLHIFFILNTEDATERAIDFLAWFLFADLVKSFIQQL